MTQRPGPGDLLTPKEEERRAREFLAEGSDEAREVLERHHQAREIGIRAVGGAEVLELFRKLRDGGTSDELREALEAASKVQAALGRLAAWAPLPSPPSGVVPREGAREFVERFREELEDLLGEAPDVEDLDPVVEEKFQRATVLGEVLPWIESALSTALEHAEEAESRLAELGWKFKPGPRGRHGPRWRAETQRRTNLHRAVGLERERDRVALGRRGRLVKVGKRGGLRALREAVRHLVEEWGLYTNDGETREALALALAGLFPPEDLDTDASSPLGKTLSNVLDAKPA